jgi:alpha/beta superfamily hydrolase
MQEEIFYILRCKGNANQNIIVVPSPHSQNSSHQENKKQQMLARVWWESNTYTLLVEM